MINFEPPYIYYTQYQLYTIVIFISVCNTLEKPKLSHIVSYESLFTLMAII